MPTAFTLTLVVGLSCLLIGAGWPNPLSPNSVRFMVTGTVLCLVAVAISLFGALAYQLCQ